MLKVKFKKRKPKAKFNIIKKVKKMKEILLKLNVRRFSRFFFLKRGFLLYSTIRLSLQDHPRALLLVELVGFWGHQI
jgi:hypothetical protein